MGKVILGTIYNSYKMFRQVAQKIGVAVSHSSKRLLNPRAVAAVSSARQMSDVDSTDAEMEAAFNHPAIDGWQIRQLVHRIAIDDAVPEPSIVIAGMKACRRNNDYALATRFLEVVRFKCGSDVKTIWPYMMQEVQPTLSELGISTLEQMGYDKPELALQDVDDM